MTATYSPKSLPFRNALRVVNQNKKMTIVTCILYALGIPLSVLSAMLELFFESHRKDSDLMKVLDSMNLEFYMAIGMVFLGVAVFMGMFAAINSFTELHKKSKVDMLYALPLTGRQRFFSDYLGGCLVYIVPYVISVLLGWLAMLGIAPFVNWDGTMSYDSFGEFMGEIGKTYFLASFGLLLLMLLYYTLSTFVTVCCGTLFECIYTNILLNCLVPGTVALVIGIICSEVSLDFEYTWQIVGYMSPIGGLFYLAMLLTGELDTGYEMISNSYEFRAAQFTMHQMLPSYIRWAIVIVLVTAALLVLSWQLYIRRKSESVGKPFVYILVYYVMLTLVTVSILCIMEARVYGPVILFAAIVYFIMEVIRKRGFKKFWLSVITYIATVGVSVGAFLLIVNTDCFGRTKYVPSPLTVSSVKVEFNTDGYNIRYALEYTDRDVISAVTGLHRDIVSNNTNGERSADRLEQDMAKDRWAQLCFDPYNYSNYSPYSTNIPIYSNNYDNNYTDAIYDSKEPLGDDFYSSYVDTTSVEFTYYTLTGNTIHRSYQVTPDEYQKLCNIVQGTKLYAEASGTGMEARLKNNLGSYDSGEERTVPYNFRMEVKSCSANRGTVPTSVSVTANGGAQTVHQLAEAYRTDLENMTAEDFCTADYDCMIYDMPVYTCCTNTMAVLRNAGFKGFTTEERFGIQDTDDSSYIFSNDSSFCGYDCYAFRIYAPGEFRTASFDYQHSTVAENYVTQGDPTYEDYYTFGYGVQPYLKESYPELYELMRVAKQNYITDEDCYLLYCGGTPYIIPAEYSDLAEKVISKGSLYAFTRCTGLRETDLDLFANSYYSGDYYDSTAGASYYDDAYNYNYDYDTIEPEPMY